jgi:hypothetical protein
MYEAGKDILTRSLTGGRDFSKSMVTVSSGGIAVYLALLRFVVGDKYVPSGTTTVPLAVVDWQLPTPLAVVLPGFLFLVSSVLFAWAAMPKETQMSLDDTTSIETARAKLLSGMKWATRVAFLLFTVASAASLLLIATFLTSVQVSTTS